MTTKSKGTNHFIFQRLTAIINLTIGIPAFYFFLSYFDRDHAEVRELIAKEYIWIPMIIYILSLSYHMKIGMGHVLDDYIDNITAKKYLSFLNFAYVGFVAFSSSVSLIILGLFIN
tara:strand:- start:1523 stop:1870 length:348 start_codon:yes stop_codon:yes gene_type:complete